MTARLLIAESVRAPEGVVGEAVLVDGNRIAAVGPVERLRTGDLPETRYPGATIVAGLRDAHLHPVGYTAALQQPSLKEAADFAEVGNIIAAAAHAQAPGTALTALRLDDESLAEGRLPDRHLLDAMVPERPVLLMRYCGHIAVANTAALELAGIGRDTADPAGGVIDRDEYGHPTGVLRETALEAVTAAVGPLAPAITPDDVVGALTALASTGITGVGAMAATDSGLWGGAASELDLLLEAGARSSITLDVFVIARTAASLAEAAERIGGAGPKVRFTGVKIFSDGSLGGHTAAMHQPFSDEPGELGTNRLDPAWAEDLAKASLRLGGMVAIHAIGDRANTGVLDLMERLIRQGADPAMLRIEHASVLTCSDIERFGRLGITASVQPAFIASETDWLEKRVGPERILRTYAFRSLADAGAPLAGGSDSPVEPPHPLLGIAAARDRLGLVPGESLNAAEALSLFTTGAARAVGGSAGIEPGKPATFTVLDQDPVDVAPDAVRGTHVLAIWVEGEEVEFPADAIAWQA
ncbi:MAG: amidohydrolase [Acidimicrobiia bacterium]